MCLVATRCQKMSDLREVDGMGLPKWWESIVVPFFSVLPLSLLGWYCPHLEDRLVYLVCFI